MYGSFFIQKDTIYFCDRQLASIFLYDLNGNFLKTYLGLGHGPNEILGLHVLCNNKSEEYAIMDEQLNIYLLDNKWNKIHNSRLDFSTKKSLEELLRAPDPNEIGIYEVEYAKNNLKFLGKNYLIFPLVTEHVNYNGYGGKNAKHFYQNSYTLAIADIKSGKIIDIFCNRSPSYEQYKYIPNFKYVIFETQEDNLYFSFSIDPLIYSMNFKDSTLYSFGNKGINMNIDYRQTTQFEEADDNYFEDMDKYGQYHYLKYIPETSILFRGLSYGEPLTTHGLQVYKDNTLVAEYTVPQEFQVIGYNYPYYYAAGEPQIDENKMIIYKFKLD